MTKLKQNCIHHWRTIENGEYDHKEYGRQCNKCWCVEWEGDDKSKQSWEEKLLWKIAQKEIIKEALTNQKQEILGKLPLGLFLNHPTKGNNYYSKDYQDGYIAALTSIKKIIEGL